MLKQFRNLTTKEIYDVLIVGGGPAGLNAALILARCRRRILVFDTANPRNKKSKALHGFLTRDGMNPNDFLQAGRKELQTYNIEIYNEEVVQAAVEDTLFKITTKNGDSYISKKLLLATGILDILPDIEGMSDYFGTSIFHCPYCDGWEMRDKALAVYGKEKRGYELSLSLKTWSNNVVLLTDGDVYFNEEEQATLQANGIRIYMEKVNRVEGNNEQVERVIFTNNEVLFLEGIFICNGYYQHSGLGYQLNLHFSEKKVIVTDQNQETTIPGLFVAGDADKDMHFIIIAAAEGAKAGTRINMELQKEERQQPAYFFKKSTLSIE